MGFLERRRRRRRARELERRLVELDRWDARHGLGSVPPPPGPGPGGGSRLRRVPVVVGVLVALAAGVMHPAVPGELRDRLGWAPERLRPPAETSGSAGAHTFLATTGEGEPVGYDPCSVLEVVVNPEGAPEDHRALLDSAVASTAEAAGLAIEVVGETDDRDYQTRRAGDPALVMWATEAEVPALAGDVAGVGGSTHVRPVYGGRPYFVSGMVVLDREAFEQMPGPGWRQAVVDHEFGHLVGLGHVEDPSQLMYEGTPMTQTYGSGDLAGLAALGAVPCR